MLTIKNLFTSKNPVPIICGSYVNALGLLRSFGANNISSVIIDFKVGIAFASKYSKWFKCPDPRNEISFLKFLISLGKRLSSKGLLITTNDIWLLPIAKNKEKLSQYFIIPMSDWEIIKMVLNKTLLYDFAGKHDIPHPKTVIVKDFNGLYNKISKLKFPILLKPSLTTDFAGIIEGTRNTIVNNKIEIEKWVENIYKNNIKNVEIIAQEFIPGETKNLYTITSYTNKEGILKAFSIGHKIRQYPLKAGTITSGKVMYNEQLFKSAKHFFNEFKYHGIANTEFKFDVRDNEFKLIEINARPGMWNSSSFATGVNLPMIMYQDLVFGKNNKNMIFCKKELVWKLSILDYMAYVKSLDISFYSIKNMYNWWKSFEKNYIVYAIFDINDIGPFLFDLFKFIIKSILILLRIRPKIV